MQSKAILATFFLFYATQSAPALSEQKPIPKPIEYELELVWIPASQEFIFKVGGVGFKSEASLREFLSRQSPGTKIRWSPGCIRFGNEPLLSSPEKMEAFKDFLENEGIELIMIPSG